MTEPTIPWDNLRPIDRELDRAWAEASALTGDDLLRAHRRILEMLKAEREEREAKGKDDLPIQASYREKLKRTDAARRKFEMSLAEALAEYEEAKEAEGKDDSGAEDDSFS
jgi:hypothetical protein